MTAFLSQLVQLLFATFGQAVKAATLMPVAASSGWDTSCHICEKKLMVQEHISHG